MISSYTACYETDDFCVLFLKMVLFILHCVSKKLFILFDTLCARQTFPFVCYSLCKALFVYAFCFINFILFECILLFSSMESWSTLSQVSSISSIKYLMYQVSFYGILIMKSIMTQYSAEIASVSCVWKCHDYQRNRFNKFVNNVSIPGFNCQCKFFFRIIPLKYFADLNVIWYLIWMIVYGKWQIWWYSALNSLNFMLLFFLSVVYF